MYVYIPDEEYNLTSKEVKEILNNNFYEIFNKTIETKDITTWTKNFEINAIKNDKGKWAYRMRDIEDFIFRYKNNILHKFNSSYNRRTYITAPRETLHEIFAENEGIFQHLVCILTTLHPYALYNDPERKYRDIGRHEGGIIFKDAAVHFGTYSVTPKTTALELRQQRLLYPVIIAQVFGLIVNEYLNTSGKNVKERLLTAGWNLVEGRISYEEFNKEVNDYRFGGWRGLFHNYEEITGNKMIWVEMVPLSESELD